MIIVSIISLIITIIVSRAIAVITDMYFADKPFARAYQLGLITLTLFIGFGVIGWFT